MGELIPVSRLILERKSGDNLLFMMKIICNKNKNWWRRGVVAITTAQLSLNSSSAQV